ncbi:MAG: hypothetical protein COW88_00545 [Candidatus Lloydbacteria bacterium CG22_combo_CG10-13_8_21_14_all_47_15]|uniref:histidine kinase n=1 Tax=Candidatus Lloydbacteria bacterium CG22_combo_CG10-13_8_21_14_all_47_15 TaxID=1974635 RepID=A0A2H0CW01_9BACT|nr:MAG: hypothetical protein COW88_00545 [Candidatus Lloydbacteria bacterium CG22_combo_CG10-13_8_21_14_all_47_15]
MIQGIGTIDIFSNLDLLSVAIAVAAIGVLGFTVYYSNKKSATALAFFLFSIITIAWSIANYFQYNISDPEFSFRLTKIVIYLATWHAFLFFHLFYVFPKEHFALPNIYKRVLIPFVAIASLVTLTPLVFESIGAIGQDGHITKIINGPAIALFGTTVLSFILTGLYLLIQKMRSATGTEKHQLRIILIGTLLTFILLIIFNFILPVFFNNSDYIPLGAVFLLPFVMFTAYAIFRQRLFDIKVLGTSFLIFVLAIAVLLEVIFSDSNSVLIFRISTFLLVLTVGILLIRGILREIETREKMERLAKDLARANARLRELDQQKSEFLSIASHQLRSPLTAIKGYSSMLLEGSFGEITSKKISEAIDRIFESSQRLVVIVNDLLNVSRIEQGRMKYDFIEFDLKKTIADTVLDMQPIAEHRGLALSFAAPAGDMNITADAGKITQIISNLIDNAIKYTPHGSVSVILEKKKADTVLIAVKDTGIGIPAVEQEKLFQKFSRAKDAAKTNTSGTGLGLYVVAQIALAHHGRAWAESEGEGRGSVFYVELPTHVTKET